MPEKRAREATEEKVMAIRKLTTKEAVEVVSEMKRGRKFIRGTKGQDLKLRVTIESLATGSQYEADALLDSGATGSCVNKDYVEAQGLQIKKLPLPLPVYNADGTLNEGGAIEGFVEVRMLIGDHAERIKLAVTNLGKTDIFLGLDRLRYHNPNIDRAESTLTIDRCTQPCEFVKKCCKTQRFRGRLRKQRVDVDKGSGRNAKASRR